MSGLRLSEVSKVFDGAAVVDRVSLGVEEGEFVVLVGPSGCGKTTTLRMLAGLEAVSAGRIFIGARDVTDVPPRERNVAMVFQSYALYPHKTVAGNLGFALKLARRPADEIARRVDEVARALDIGHLLHRKPAQLSGGQRQRVAVGRAIIRDPEVFLFDEPLSNLDAKLRTTTRAELLKLHRRLRATMVYVTHDQTEAMTLGDRIVVMDQGRVQQIGTPLEVYDDPDNRFVASFIGSPAMNFFAARSRRDGGATEARFGEVLLRLPAEHPAGLRERVTLGIRPECLSLPPAPGELRVAARVEAVEHPGAETLIEMTLGGLPALARVERRKGLRPATPLTFGVRADAVLAFDTGTGTRLRAGAPRGGAEGKAAPPAPAPPERRQGGDGGRRGAER